LARIPDKGVEMTRNIVMLVVVAICGVPAVAAAQTALPISVDQRVRVWTSAPEAITGRVVSVSADGLELSNEGGAPLRVARPTVQRIERQPRRHVERRGRHEGRGLGRDHRGGGRRRTRRIATRRDRGKRIERRPRGGAWCVVRRPVPED
jgi:hypothetical protein